MVIVDSSVWIGYLANETNKEIRWLESAIGSSAIGLTDLNLCEVLQGVRHERRLRAAIALLTSLPVFDIHGMEIAIESARNYRSLRGKGVTVRTTIDCLIATFCIREGFRLLHRDSDFDHFERHLGLTVLHP